ncbi:HEPN domain-containing protein [Candidatus Poriferisocius sp.]|uniref:ApeA N-terminal domain 1-containing protein n=1 Tax=Candidatus Poriferisocius sp. TaxID=3101276 RepID=UPI003B02B108
MLGEWWIPDLPTDPDTPYELPDQRTSGELQGDENGPWNLNTLGGLSQDGRVEFFGSDTPARSHDTVWGMTDDGKCVSLFDTWRSSFTTIYASPATGKETWSVGGYASGRCWVSKDSDISFIRIEYDVLGDWASDRVMSSHELRVEDQSLLFPSASSYEAHIDEARIEIKSGWHLDASSDGYKATRTASIEIYDDLQIRDVIEKWVHPLRQLLSLLSLKPARAVGITVQLADSEELVDLHFSLLQSDKEYDGKRGHMDMLATRKAFAEHGVDVSQLLTNYFDLLKNGDLKMALSYFIQSQERTVDKSADATFVNAFRTIELLHTLIGGTSLPPDEYSHRVETIIESSPDDLKEWVCRMLSNRNNKGLTRRVGEVFGLVGKLSLMVRTAWPDVDAEIVKYRSIASHGNPTQQGSLGLRYYAYAKSLHWIARYIFLIQLGLPRAAVSRIIRKHDYFRQEIRMIREWHAEVEENTSS